MIDLPITLVVTFLILAVCVPVASGMMDDFGKGSTVSAAKAEAERIDDAVKKAYYSGAGSTGTVAVSLSGGACLVLGGEGSDSYCISIVVDDIVEEKMYLQRPSVKFLGEPTYIMGNRTISIECAIDGGSYGVKVSVID